MKQAYKQAVAVVAVIVENKKEVFDIEKKWCYYNDRKGATNDGSPDILNSYEK